MGNGSEGEKILNEFRRSSCREIAFQKEEVLQHRGRYIEIRLTKTNRRANYPDDHFCKNPSGNDQG